MPCEKNNNRISTNAEWHNVVRRVWRSNATGCDCSSMTIYVSFQPRSTQSIPSTTEQIWKKCKEEPLQGREKNPVGRDWDSIKGTKNKTDPRNYCFSPAKSPWLRENPSSHFIRTDLGSEKIWRQWSHFLENSGYTWISCSHRGQMNTQAHALRKGEILSSENTWWQKPSETLATLQKAGLINSELKPELWVD